MLEDKISEMTKALDRVAVALEQLGGAAIPTPSAPQERPERAAHTPEAPKKRGRPRNDDKAPVGKSPPEPVADPETAMLEPAAGIPPYDDVAKAITMLARVRGREETIDFLSRYGVRSGKELEPGQYADVIAHAGRVVEGGEI